MLMFKSLSPRIDLDRIILYRHTPQDAEEIFYGYASKSEATKFLVWKTHESIEETRSYLKSAVLTWSARSQFAFGVRLKSSGRLIGACGCLHQEGVFQIGYVFSPSVWGQGYAVEACRGLVDEIIKNPVTRKIHSFVDVDNHRSMRVLEKAGFIQSERVADYFVAVNQGGVKRDAWIYQFPFSISPTEA